jgi:thiol:disulfide interchange protein DsbA
MASLPEPGNAAAAWRTFQRAYLTELSLGVADTAHDAMYEAIWTTGELGVTDLKTGRLRTKLPTIEDAARFYQRVAGVKANEFVAASKSFGVDLKARQADSQIIAMQVTGTPTLVVNGKYRLNNEHQMSADQIIELVKFLVAKETK